MESAKERQSSGSGQGGNNWDSISDLKSSWKQFDGAGSHLLFNLCNALAGSQYGAVTKDLMVVLGPVFGCGESELVLGRLKEMDNLLSRLQGQRSGGSPERQPGEVQMMYRCLLLFVKLQAEYHQLCSTAISSVIDHLTTTGDTQDNRDVLQQLKSLNLGNYAPSRQSPTRSGVVKKSSALGSNSPKSPKHGLFKGSLFSLFERKNSPEEGNSAFYVDIEQTDNSSEVSQVEGKAQSHMIESNQSDVLSQLGLDPCLTEEGNCAINQTQPPGINGQVATQEELDSVINLLSGVSFGVATMQTIPEHRDHMTLQVPALTRGSLSPASSDSGLMSSAMLMRSKAQQRHSEGSIDLSGFGGMGGTNTWPYQHRSSLPGGQLTTNPHISYDFASPSLPHCYGNDFRPMTLPPGGAGHFQVGNKWGFPDSKLNRTWPMNNLAATGSVTDTMNSSWSGAQDSDELSDDSSCDNQFQAFTHLQPGDTRPDLYHDNSGGGSRKPDRPGEVKHHSLEDLLDGRSNTWPQQLQPWSQSHHGLDLVDTHEPPPGYHRPVQMQMSDPLSRSNIWQNSGELPPHQQPPPVHGLGQM